MQQDERRLWVDRGAELTADWVIDELRKIAGTNMADYMKSTTDGDPYLESLRASSNG